MRTFFSMVLLLALACAIDQVMLKGRYTDLVIADAKTVGHRLNIQFNKIVSKLSF
jgi:hypothetical protein